MVVINFFILLIGKIGVILIKEEIFNKRSIFYKKDPTESFIESIC